MATQTLDANGNAIVNGYATNLTPDQLAKSSTISSSTLAPVPTVPIASPDYKDTSSTANTGLAYIQSASNDAQANLDALNKQGQTTSSEVASLESSQGNKSQDLATQYNTKDENGNSVNSLAGQLRKYNAQSQALNYDNFAKTLAEENKATGQNITSTAVSRNTADATRENTINIAKLAMQTAITKADYDTAKEYADQMVTAKYDKIEADIKAKLTNLAAFDKYQLTPAEDKAKKASEALLKKQEQDVADKKANDKAISDLVINGSAQGAPKDIISKAQLAKTPEEAAAVLGLYAGDYLSTKIKKAQLEDLNLKNKKAYNDLYQNPTGLKTLSYDENQKFNSTPEKKKVDAAIAYVQALNEYRNAIETYGTGEVLGEGSGVINSAYQAVVGSVKDYYNLGTLDNGVEKLVGLGIPAPSIWGQKSSRVSSLDQQVKLAKDTIKTNSDQLLNTSYKNTQELKSLMDNANGVLMETLPNEDFLNSLPTGSGMSQSTASFWK